MVIVAIIALTLLLALRSACVGRTRRDAAGGSSGRSRTCCSSSSRSSASRPSSSSLHHLDQGAHRHPRRCRPTLDFDIDQIVKNYRDVLIDRGLPRLTSGTRSSSRRSRSRSRSCIGTPAAYAFSRLRFRRRDDWASTILSFRFMPAVAVAIPILLMMRFVDLDDTLPGLVIPYIAFSLPLDGLDPHRLLRRDPARARRRGAGRRLHPPRRPAAGHAAARSGRGSIVAAIFAAIFIWNEFLVGLYLVNSQALKTIPLGAAGLISAQRPIDWNVAATVGVVTIIPIFIFSLFIAALHRARRHRRRRTLTPDDGGRHDDGSRAARGRPGLGRGTDGPARRAHLLRGELTAARSRVWERGRGVNRYAYTAGGPELVRARRRTASLYVCQNGGTVGPVARRGDVGALDPAHRPGGWPRRRSSRPSSTAGASTAPTTSSSGPTAASTSPTRAPTGRPTRSPRTCSSWRRTARGRLLAELDPPTFPNGIAIEADGSVVWAESYTGMVRRLRLDTGAIEDIARLPGEKPIADGMAVGADGRLYVTTVNGGGIDVITPDGTLRPAHQGGRHPDELRVRRARPHHDRRRRPGRHRRRELWRPALAAGHRGRGRADLVRPIG